MYYNPSVENDWADFFNYSLMPGEGFYEPIYIKWLAKYSLLSITNRFKTFKLQIPNFYFFIKYIYLNNVIVSPLSLFI